MLQHISWQEYLTAISLLVIVYYAIVALVLYRHELFNLLGKSTRSSDGSVSREESERTFPDVLGTTRSPQQTPVTAEEQISSEELSSSTVVEPEETIKTVENQTVAVAEQVTDLIEAINQIVDEIADPSRHEVAISLQGLLLRYSHIGASDYRLTITQLIHDACQDKDIDYSLIEINTWWPTPPIKP